jgi:hypothetical protein
MEAGRERFQACEMGVVEAPRMCRVREMEGMEVAGVLLHVHADSGSRADVGTWTGRSPHAHMKWSSRCRVRTWSSVRTSERYPHLNN